MKDIKDTPVETEEKYTKLSICTTCGRNKKPIGRNSRDNGLCQDDCDGYRQEPYPTSDWPHIETEMEET